MRTKEKRDKRQVVERKLRRKKGPQGRRAQLPTPQPLGLRAEEGQGRATGQAHPLQTPAEVSGKLSE